MSSDKLTKKQIDTDVINKIDDLFFECVTVSSKLSGKSMKLSELEKNITALITATDKCLSIIPKNQKNQTKQEHCKPIIEESLNFDKASRVANQLIEIIKNLAKEVSDNLQENKVNDAFKILSAIKNQLTHFNNKLTTQIKASEKSTSNSDSSSSSSSSSNQAYLSGKISSHSFYAPQINLASENKFLTRLEILVLYAQSRKNKQFKENCLKAMELFKGNLETEKNNKKPSLTYQKNRQQSIILHHAKKNKNSTSPNLTYIAKPLDSGNLKRHVQQASSAEIIIIFYNNEDGDFLNKVKKVLDLVQVGLYRDLKSSINKNISIPQKNILLIPEHRQIEKISKSQMERLNIRLNNNLKTLKKTLQSELFKEYNTKTNKTSDSSEGSQKSKTPTLIYEKFTESLERIDNLTDATTLLKVIDSNAEKLITQIENTSTSFLNQCNQIIQTHRQPLQASTMSGPSPRN